ncbi:GAF domain-containing protein [Alteribacillus sp. HJP-4]|uniref:GAF domain-containing protein n=1 Tax=Alteribacillus sp. HJP-4 TaxID=2775394 RepID=UPI0035CD35C9
MSISTDLASIQILADLFKDGSKSTVLTRTVHTLCDKVEYIDWAGVYVYEGEETRLMASASSEGREEELQSQLAFSITGENGAEKGVLVVKSKGWIVFDVTDVSTLKEIAGEFGKII